MQMQVQSAKNQNYKSANIPAKCWPNTGQYRPILANKDTGIQGYRHNLCEQLGKIQGKTRQNSQRPTTLQDYKITKKQEITGQDKTNKTIELDKLAKTQQINRK